MPGQRIVVNLVEPDALKFLNERDGGYYLVRKSDGDVPANNYIGLPDAKAAAARLGFQPVLVVSVVRETINEAAARFLREFPDRDDIVDRLLARWLIHAGSFNNNDQIRAAAIAAGRRILASEENPG